MENTINLDEESKPKVKRKELIELIEKRNQSDRYSHWNLREQFYHLTNDGEPTKLDNYKGFMVELMIILAGQPVTFQEHYFKENGPVMLYKLYQFFALIAHDDCLDLWLDEARVRWDEKLCGSEYNCLIQKYSTNEK